MAVKTPEIGDRVKVLADSVGHQQRAQPKIGQCGTIEMIVDPGIAVVTFNGYDSVSYWLDELKVIRRQRKK